MSNHPRITVLMPVYNCELYIKESIDSILNQTFSDYEFIIIDDASTDSTIEIIKSYTDSRIRLIEKPQNSGYTNSLNHGLEIAKGEYIARMDADDISLNKRFAKQIDFLDANPDVILCGTSFKVVGNDRHIFVPETHDAIKLALLKGNCLVHPSVMFRNIKKEGFSILYDVSKEPAEDYDLWIRLLLIGKLYNLQECLLNYRVHNTQVSQKRQKQQIDSALETRLNLLNYLNCEIKLSERKLMKKIILDNEILSFNELGEFLVLKNKLVFSNSNSFFDKRQFMNYLVFLEENLFKKYFFRRDNYSLIIWIEFLKSKKRFTYNVSFYEKLKFYIKTLIFYKRK